MLRVGRKYWLNMMTVVKMQKIIIVIYQIFEKILLVFPKINHSAVDGNLSECLNCVVLIKNFHVAPGLDSPKKKLNFPKKALFYPNYGIMNLKEFHDVLDLLFRIPSS